MSAAAACPPGLRRAQDTARAIAAEVLPMVAVGISERALQDQVNRVAAAHGSTGQWTPPTTRVGLGTLVAHPAFPMQDRVAVYGDTAFLDVTPTIDGWLGDFCTSVVVGADPEAEQLLVDCRWVQRKMIAKMAPGFPASALFEFGMACLAERGLKLLDLLDNFGHSVGREFAAEGFIDADNDTPMIGAWTVEPQVGRRGRGAKYEDIVWLADDGSKVVV